MNRMPDEYEKLLDRALKQIPHTSPGEDRFKIPEPEVDVTGNRTTLRNLKDIADALNREPTHLMRYLLREVGTAGNLDGVKGLFQGKFEVDVLRDRVNRYVEEFVICPECGKPDTKIMKQGRAHLLKCEACGARHSVKGV